LSVDEMDDGIKQEEIEYNEYEEDLRMSQEEEKYTAESDTIDKKITLQRRRVDQVKFEIKCKISTDAEARKKRKRNEEINEKLILHAHFLEIKYKNDEIYNIKHKLSNTRRQAQGKNREPKNKALKNITDHLCFTLKIDKHEKLLYKHLETRRRQVFWGMSSSQWKGTCLTQSE